MNKVGGTDFEQCLGDLGGMEDSTKMAGNVSIQD